MIDLDIDALTIRAHFEKVGQKAVRQTKEKDHRFSKFHRPDL
jgi:hypothetical protein